MLPSHAKVSEYLSQIQHDPNALYAFFKAMPKGGELHYHLAGGPYPETMLKIAASGNFCVDKTTFVAIKNAPSCNGIAINELASHPKMYLDAVKSWSLKDFIGGSESAHDHFFNSFYKYLDIVADYKPQLIADVMQRAAQQNELYLELLDVPDNAYSTTFGALLNDHQDYAQKRAILLANKRFQNTIDLTVRETDRVISEARKELNCPTEHHKPACKVTIKIINFVLREQPLNNFFAQALNAFEAASRSMGNLVGVNVVQAEDGIISLRDYHQHMLILNYLHGLYPKVHITLHAGELEPQAVTPEDLRFHIHDALFVGKAERIGHGVAIAYEDKAQESLEHMAKNHIPVEVNLISNQKLLNIAGAAHPLNYYLKHQVPVVFSTDDEGVLRTDLSSQYVEAALVHKLDYAAIKQINRNALTYAFIEGKSLWDDAAKALPVTACTVLDSASCHAFIKNNRKAQLQWQLEKNLNAFEQNY